MKRAAIGRLSRVIDLISLALIVAGAALFFRAYVGMERVRTSAFVPFVPGQMEAFAMLNQLEREKRLSYFALTLVGAGISAGLYAAAHARKISRQQAMQGPLPE